MSLKQVRKRFDPPWQASSASFSLRARRLQQTFESHLHLATGMMLLVQFLQSGLCDMGINLRSGQIRMSQ